MTKTQYSFAAVGALMVLLATIGVTASVVATPKAAPAPTSPWAPAAPGILTQATPNVIPDVWVDPDTRCEYLVYGQSVVPRYSGADARFVRGCGRQ